MTVEEEALTLLLEELADPWEVPGRSKVLITSIPRNLPALVVQHPWTHPLHTRTRRASQWVYVQCWPAGGAAQVTHSVVGASQLSDPDLPVAFLPQQLVDLVVQVTDPELAQAGCEVKGQRSAATTTTNPDWVCYFLSLHQTGSSCWHRLTGQSAGSLGTATPPTPPPATTATSGD